MPRFAPAHQSAVEDFREARLRAALQSLGARLTGKPIDLLPYEDVVKMLRRTGQSDRGLREIPLNAIVGSVGRYTDFTRTFLPRYDGDQARWAKVKAFIDEQDLDALPPIEVYQIGEAYFVKDGNHRVSAARQKGYTAIHAVVTEVRTRVPLTPDASPDDLIIKAEHAAFLEYTRLDELRPDTDLTVTAPGQYAHIENHIEAQRYLNEVDQNRDLPLDEAVCAWHDEVYRPMAQAVREQGILRYFPRRTETDVYVWLTDHRAEMQHALGWQMPPDVAAAKIVAHIKHHPESVASRILDARSFDVMRSRRATGEWRSDKIIDRYSDRLFADVLVPLDGKPDGWHALDQALIVARREGSRVFGLHAAASEADAHGEAAQSIRAEFQRRCESAGVEGQLGIEAADPVRSICERAVVSDLVVLDVERPPSSLMARLGSTFTAVVRHVVRPVLAVPRSASPITRALLAYDGSAQAREALFAATYVAERWTLPLVVLSVVEAGRAEAEAIDYARRYLDMHEVQADFVQSGGSVSEAILKTATQHAADVLIMGGSGSGAIRQIVLGTSVEHVLREGDWPVLICR